MSVKLYVEGDAGRRGQHSPLRQAFRTLLEAAGMGRSDFDVVCAGPRSSAYEDFCRALRAHGQSALLLVDSETAVDNEPWRHVRQHEKDKWARPANASDDQLHLMVQIMENWFLCDRKMLAKYFGRGFNDKRLPGTERDVESIDKKRVLDWLSKATRSSQKGEYGKGKHSADLLRGINPERLRRAAPHFEKLLAALSARLPHGKR